MNSFSKSSYLVVSLNLSLLALSLLVTSCANQTYQAKPLDPAQIAANIRNKDVNNADFKAYLIKQGYAESDLPFKTWGLNELTLCALYFHPKLDVAKAQLALANAQLETAGQKQNPTLGGRLAHSNQANDDKSPWAYGLDVEIPIETGNKRQIRVEEAQHLANAARLDVAETAWQLRSQIAKELLRFHENMAQQQLLSGELNTQNALVNMLEKRVQLGALSNTELSTAKLAQQKTQFALHSEQAKAAEIRAALAADVGLTAEKFSALTLKPLDVEATLAAQSQLLEASAAKDLQEKALLNRLDIRRSLEKYAAAESKIKLEIAKQTPDISLSPGIAFEFGDAIWSLGFSALLNLVNKNQAFIAEATQLRGIEGAQFEALQNQIIGDLSQHLAAYAACTKNIEHIQLLQTTQLQANQKSQRQFDAGLIDRLELTQSQLNSAIVAQQRSGAQFNCLSAALALEDVLQQPLLDDFSLNTDK